MDKVPIVEALVVLKLDETKFGQELNNLTKRISKTVNNKLGQQMQNLGKQLNKTANFLSKVIIAPTIALGGVGFIKYLKTTDQLARQTNATLNSLKFAFSQFLFRLGEVIIKKFQLIKVMEKLKDILNNLDTKKIGVILDVVKWVAVSVIILKLASSLLIVAGALVKIRNGMIAIEAARATGAMVSNTSAGVQAGAVGSGANVLIAHLIVRIKEVWRGLGQVIKPLNKVKPMPSFPLVNKVKPMSGFPLDNTVASAKSVKEFSKVTAFNNVAGALGKLFVVLVAFDAIAKALAPELERFNVSFKDIFKALGTILKYVIQTISAVVTTILAGFSAIGSLIGLGMRTIGVAIGTGLQNIITLTLGIINSVMSGGVFTKNGRKAIGETTDSVVNNFNGGFDQIEDFFNKYFMKDLESSGNKIIDAWKNIGGKNWFGPDKDNQEAPKNVFAESISSTDISGLNKAFQDFYSQTALLTETQTQTNLLKEIAMNTKPQNSTNTGSPKWAKQAFNNMDKEAFRSVFTETTGMNWDTGLPVY